MKYTPILILTMGLLISCNRKLDVPAEYIITSHELKEVISEKENSLVLFWTDWCGGSKQTLESTYLVLLDSVKQNNLDVNLILLASDENVPLQKIKEQRELGFLAYYIERPGSNPIMNRMAIKRFINDNYPNNNVTQIDKMQFGIPVELLLNNKNEILNETNEDVSLDFKCKILKCTWKRIEE